MQQFSFTLKHGNDWEKSDLFFCTLLKYYFILACETVGSFVSKITIEIGRF